MRKRWTFSFVVVVFFLIGTASAQNIKLDDSTYLHVITPPQVYSRNAAKTEILVALVSQDEKYKKLDVTYGHQNFQVNNINTSDSGNKNLYISATSIKIKKKIGHVKISANKMSFDIPIFFGYHSIVVEVKKEHNITTLFVNYTNEPLIEFL